MDISGPLRGSRIFAALAAAIFMSACKTAVIPTDRPPMPIGEFALSRQDYPPVSVRLRHEGVVVLSILVGADGSCKEAYIRESAGQRLDEAARRTCQAKFRWQPALVGGAPSEVWTTERLRYALGPPLPWAQDMDEAVGSVLYGDWDAAVAHATAAIAIEGIDDDTRGEALRLRAIAYDRMFRHAEMLADVDRSLELSERDHASKLLIRGIALSALGMYDDAIADLTQAIAELRTYPNLFQVYYCRGLTHMRAGDTQRAQADFSTAEALEPDPARRLYSLGVAKLKLGDESGRAEVTAAIALNPDIETEARNYGEFGFD